MKGGTCNTVSIQSVKLMDLPTHSIDVARDQNLGPATVVFNCLRVCKDVEATFTTSSYRDLFDIITLPAQILFKPFRTLDLVVRYGRNVDKVLVQLEESIGFFWGQRVQRGRW